MKEEIQKILFETDLPIKECEALTQELLNLFSVSQQRELLIGALEEYNKVKYEWNKLTYEDYVNEYHPNL